MVMDAQGPQALLMKMVRKPAFIILIFGVRMKANGLCLCAVKSVQMVLARQLILSLVMRGMAAHQRALKAKLIPALILLLPAHKKVMRFIRQRLKQVLLPNQRLLIVILCHAFSLIRLRKS